MAVTDCSFSSLVQQVQITLQVLESARKKEMYNSQDTQWAQNAAGGFFEGAHGFMVNNSNFVYNAHPAESFMEKFALHTIRGAEFDSSLRSPPPTCHPGTRKAIIERMQFWLRDPCRTRRMLWLVGSAGVGKSAIMQTLAELEAKSLLLVTLFFSALNGRNDASKVIITLAYQIAAKYPLYRDFVREKVTNNPKLLEKSIIAQFVELIVEPFAKKCIYKGNYPLLMILDGLDECKGGREQRVILGLISFFTITYPNAPLLWVVASRPEAHITTFLSRANVASTYDKEEVAVDSSEACRDAEHFLRAEFERVRSAYPVTALYPQWPLESDFTKLAAAGLGLFAYATTVIRFVEDPAYSNPIGQFQKVLDVIDKAPCADGQVMAQLDILYDYILSQVPMDILPATKELLSHEIYPDLTLLCHPNFAISCIWLDMTPDVGYSAVYWLHSVLNVPLPHYAEFDTITFHHKSFLDYLRKTERSGMNTQNEERQKNIRRALRILKDVPGGGPLSLHPSDYISLCWPQCSSLNIRFHIYTKASNVLSSLSKPLEDFPLPDIAHALQVMDRDAITAHLWGILFDDDSPVVLKLRECGVIQDIPLRRLDSRRLDLMKGFYVELECRHSEAECKDPNVKRPLTWFQYPEGNNYIWSVLEKAKATSPDGLCKAIVGNCRHAWIKYTTSKDGVTRSFYFAYNI